jgi:hypothetical protein
MWALLGKPNIKEGSVFSANIVKAKWALIEGFRAAKPTNKKTMLIRAPKLQKRLKFDMNLA